MIRNPKRYQEYAERERVKQLRRLTVNQSARLVESLLVTRLIHELHFSESAPPVCLRRALHGGR